MNTERDNLAKTLREIAGGSRRSKISRLREIFDEVEAAKASGASNKTIVNGLAAHGLIFDVNNFKNARSRILKERAMEALTRATPAIDESKSIRKNRTKNASATVNKGLKPKEQVQSQIDGVETDAELVRPPGISNSAWSEIRVKAAAEKRKKL